MAIDVLYDTKRGQAALYDTTTEVPLSLELFSGTEDGFDASDEAHRFLHDATEHFGYVDIRRVSPVILRSYQEHWNKEGNTSGQHS